MYTTRDLLAIVLAAVLGLALVVAPGAVLRLQWFTFDPTSGRRGEWGNDEPRQFDAKWLWLLRGIGVVVLAIGAAIVAIPLL
ncbi:hypothetical protein L593_05125 [Salinarchaeum sp. Harcht-Bsk1]|uniref:hypothetical protein n=1 Tax=Salinarchaeum sp. Harcht-Bsk1 TaxID=1333523 RepID=UPI00034237DD|nr:hypothetical protein [Salinarchaeum sp. Harcht-Bsk1]AGN00974.1 hypothetical protein L593_05125 [Salinarchaeum sp. Harcht-Bsk1]